MTQNTARDLSDIADTFDMFASDQIASKRWQTTQRERRECDIRADVWRDAANILRNVVLTGKAP